MLNVFRVSTTLPRKLEDQGVPPALVLRKAGLPPGLFDQEKIQVSTEELFALYRTYEAHFACPLRFDARRNTIVFRKADLDRPFVTHNADLLAAVAPQLEAELEKALGSKEVAEQVKGVLKRLLAGRRPGIEDVAKELRVSSRTLQRRLTEAGATFQQLIQEARRELAHHYLRHSSLELNQTAYLLGYEDAHSFFRAFQGWEGTSPGAWRERHAPAS